MRIIPHINTNKTHWPFLPHGFLAWIEGMAHLNYLPLTVAGVNFCFFIAFLCLAVGVDIMRNAKPYFAKWSEMNMWNCVYSMIWRNGDSGAWYSTVTETAVAMNSRRRLSKRSLEKQWSGNLHGQKGQMKLSWRPSKFMSTRSRRMLVWHVADIKNIAGYDQVTQRVYQIRNYREVLQNLCLQDRKWCSNGTLSTSKASLAMTR